MPAKTNRKAARKGLEQIPGVGPSIAADLNRIGIRAVEDLKGKNPEALYDKICMREGQRVDRCVLYVMREAVYFASRKRHNPRLLKWWNWKD